MTCLQKSALLSGLGGGGVGGWLSGRALTGWGGVGVGLNVVGRSLTSPAFPLCLIPIPTPWKTLNQPLLLGPAPGAQAQGARPEHGARAPGPGAPGPDALTENHRESQTEHLTTP